MPSKNGHTSPPYISHVRLKGYKSIIDTKVDLHPGLNIIIGPNGSGKTNFLEFLRKLIRIDFPINDFLISLTIVTGTKHTDWQVKSTNRTEVDLSKQESSRVLKERIYQKGQKKPRFKNYLYTANGRHVYQSKGAYKLLDCFHPHTFISFNTPNQIIGLSTKISISINKTSFKANRLDTSFSIKFIEDFLLSNFYSKTFSNNSFSKEKLLVNELEINELLKRNLKKFSPINDIRIERGLSIKQTALTYNVTYIGFEFLVSNMWLSWDMLSDGTKRLFYLISEVTLTNSICFIEEPEIGVHPEQYLKILNFLKESSEDKQIIMTTHAPRSLDILRDNELNRIILTRYEEEAGTKMRHLSKTDIKHAISYREEAGSTSELWSYTGFFDDEEII